MTTPMTQAIYHDNRTLPVKDEEAALLITLGVVVEPTTLGGIPVYYVLEDGKSWQDVYAALNDNRRKYA